MNEFMTAIQNGDLDTVSKLLVQDVTFLTRYDENNGEIPPITLAVALGKNIIFKSMLDFAKSKDFAIDINKKDPTTKMTALLHAASNNDIESVNILLNYPGIDPNIRNRNGFTAVMLASFNGNDKIVELLARKSNLEIRDNMKGRTAMDLAQTERTKEILTTELVKETSKSINPNPVLFADAAPHTKCATTREQINLSPTPKRPRSTSVF